MTHPSPSNTPLCPQAVDFDNRKIGLHSSNLWDSAGGLPFGGCIVMLCVDIALYAFLAFYLDNVLPSESSSGGPGGAIAI